MYKYNVFTKKLDYMAKSSYGVKFEFGIRVVSGNPEMEETDKNQWVWIPKGKHYFFNTNTEELMERRD